MSKLLDGIILKIMLTFETIPFEKVARIELYDKSESSDFQYFPFRSGSIFRSPRPAGFYYRHSFPGSRKFAKYPTSARTIRDEYIIEDKILFSKPQVSFTDVNGEILTFHYDTYKEAKLAYIKYTAELMNHGISIVQKNHSNE